jgi:hypothetical protein
MEFIYQSLPGDPQIASRSFRLVFRGVERTCEFARASDRLNLIAQTARFTLQKSESKHRNLDYYQAGMEYRRNHVDQFPGGNPPPKSFWVRDVDWDEDAVVELSLHINFYMCYYDRFTPIILTLDDEPDSRAVEVERAHRGPFPGTISAQVLDADLLNLWTSTITEDPIRRFLHSYQILEYAGHYYIKDEALERIRKLLIEPNMLDNLHGTAAAIFSALAPWKKDDDERIKQIIKDYVAPSALWPVIEPYKDAFSQKVTFDGGHVQEPLISPGMSADKFATQSWPDTLCNRLTTLRNSVVHAREHRNEVSVVPTARNYDRLRPWALLASGIAEQVLVFRKN